MVRAIVLGGGMIGRTVAQDLCTGSGFDVTVADVRAEVLAKLQANLGVAIQCVDLSDAAAIERLVSDYDVVVGALSSALGFGTVAALARAGAKAVDISFMTEDADSLDALAREHGATIVFDCGIAPGLSNMLAARAASLLEPCERLAIYVGGLPKERLWPYEYKAGFDPADVIEEYVRPARLVEHGQLVVKEALAEPELVDFAGVGTLEAFLTDGLRSLARTLSIPFMCEKTMRYPGHIALMRVLRHSGFFSTEPVEVGGQKVVPRQLTSALLFPNWTFAEGEADLTVLRVVAEGRRKGEALRLVWDLLDSYDATSGTRSMSRTTGFVATAMVRLLADGRFAQPGVYPPEIPAREPGVLEAVEQMLAARGVRLAYREESLA